MLSFQTSFLAGLAPGYVEIFLGFCLLILLVFGSIKGDKSFRFIGYLSLGVLAVACVMTSLSEGHTEVASHGLFVRNNFTGFCKIIVLMTVLIVLMMTLRPLERENMNRFEYPILVLLSTLGMMIMISSNDLMSMYLGLELQSLALYILVGLKRELPRVNEAGVKYFILGVLASAFILYGSSFLYGFTGVTQWDTLFSIIRDHDFHQSYGLNFGLILVLCGLLFKLALVPFHMWSPDVYQGSPIPVTLLVASAPKIAMFALLLRLFGNAPVNLMAAGQFLLVSIIVLSLTIGSFGALFQTNVKRLLGYGAIAHMSYGLMGILSQTSAGYDSVLIYLVIYVVTTLGIFAILLHLRKNGKPLDTIDDFTNLSQQYPLMAASMTLFLFSLIGIPPLGGFFTKLNIFNATLQQGYSLLVIYAVFMSVVSAGYYLKIIKAMYFDRASLETDVPEFSELTSLKNDAVDLRAKSTQSIGELKHFFELTPYQEIYSMMIICALVVLFYTFIHRWFMVWIQDSTSVLFF